MRGIPGAVLLLLLLAACGGPEAPPVPADAAVAAGGYEAFLWCFSGEIPDASLLRRLGITGVNLDGHQDPSILEGTGLHHYVGHAAGSGTLHLRNLPDPGEHPVRPRCLSDPKVIARLREQVRASVALHRASRPFGYALDDEASIARGVNPVDYCFSVHCMERMRKWLGERYGDVAELNEAWGTDFGSFAEVRPLTTAEIRAREYGKPRLAWNLAPWMDHRELMDDVLCETLLRLGEEAPSGSAPAGVLGLPFPGAFGGHNSSWTLRLPFLEIYDLRGSKMLARSFLRMGRIARPVNTVFSSGRDEAAARYLLWRNFALGDRGSIVWSNREFVVDGKPTEYARWLSPVLRELTGPLGDALAGAEPIDQGVGILYSPASVRVGWMIDSEEDGDTWPRRLTSYEVDHSSVLLAREATQRILEDTGVGYRFVTESDFAHGGLEEKGIRVLFLPKALSLSSGEELRSFVERGGVVIADFATGLFDPRGRGRGAGLLDPLFGVRREDGRAREKAGRPDARSRLRHRGLVVMEPSLRLAGGKAEATVGGAPAVVTRRLGKGFAVYLNLGLADYLEARLSRDGGKEIRQLLAGFLQEAGVRPLYPVFAGMGARLDRILTLRYRKGEGEILAVLRNHAVVTKSGGKALLGDGTATSVSRIRVVLPGPREVTNLRTGEEYGRITVIQDDLLPLEANLYRIR